MAIRFPRVRVMPTSNEHLVWDGRPSPRVLAPYVFAVIMLFVVFLFLLSGKTEGVVLAAALVFVGLLALPFFRRGAKLPSLLHVFCIRYQLTNQRIIITQGLWEREVSEIDLVYFRSTSVYQSQWLRWLGIGNVHLHRELEDASTVVLMAVTNPIDVKELVRTSIVTRRAEQDLSYIDIV